MKWGQPHCISNIYIRPVLDKKSDAIVGLIIDPISVKTFLIHKKYNQQGPQKSKKFSDLVCSRINDATMSSLRLYSITFSNGAEYFATIVVLYFQNVKLIPPATVDDAERGLHMLVKLVSYLNLVTVMAIYSVNTSSPIHPYILILSKQFYFLSYFA